MALNPTEPGAAIKLRETLQKNRAANAEKERIRKRSFQEALEDLEAGMRADAEQERNAAESGAMGV